MLPILAFFVIDVSQGSAATRLRCGGIVNKDCVAYLSANLLEKRIWTSAEQGMGRWVMGHGSNGSQKSDESHGSWVTRSWPM